MELSAVRIAGILATVSNVVFVCKQGSFAERLYKEGDYKFACESVNFISRTFSPAMLFRVRSILKTYNIRNVIFLGASELKTLYFSFLGIDLKVIVWHGTTKSSPKKDILHRLVYSCVNYHVAISLHLLRNIKTIVPESRKAGYGVIRPSLKKSYHKTGGGRAVGRNYINITQVGRIAGGKGQIDAALSCRGLHAEGFRFKLNIIGQNDGNPYAKKLEKTLLNLPYKQHVALLGFVDDVDGFLAQSDIFLFPSSGEGMPGAFIEALHHKVVCIAYDNTVFPEFSDLGFYIHRVKNNDIEALSEVLVTVAANIENELKKSEPNNDLATRIFQVERELSDWVQVLD